MGGKGAQPYKANSTGTVPHPVVTPEAARDEDAGTEPGAGPALLAAHRGCGHSAGQERGDLRNAGEGTVGSAYQGGDGRTFWLLGIAGGTTANAGSTAHSVPAQ